MKKGIVIDKKRLLADILKQAGSIPNFARLHNLSESSLYKCVRGDCNPTDRTLGKLCAATGRQRRYYIIKAEGHAPMRTEPKVPRPKTETPESHQVTLAEMQKDNTLAEIRALREENRALREEIREGFQSLREEVREALARRPQQATAKQATKIRMLCDEQGRTLPTEKELAEMTVSTADYMIKQLNNAVGGING